MDYPARLTFGTWQISGARFGHIANDEALAVIDVALESGITCFDTSNVYGNGRGQVLLGHALRGRVRESVRVTAKLGYLTGIDGFQGVATTLTQRFSTSALQCGVEETLARLDMSYVDDLLLHDPPTPVLDSPEVWDTLQDIRRQGLARHVGVSTVPKKVPRAVACGATVIQMPVFEGQDMPMLGEALDCCASQGVRLMARSPLQGGRLLEGFSGDALAARVRGLVDYVLEQRGVTTVVLGFMRMAEVQSLLAMPGTTDGILVAGKSCESTYATD